ncbi:MAG: hypothetical protein KF758_04300 [Anaerolineales bacterium]|nr:hypothetical protein [Anaerolineales bacterium]MBX3036115.1 hypothetical protein [Anaerolineales bacterium]
MQQSKQLSLGDRYAEITVLTVTIIALVIGWFYKASIENASLPFSADGISAEAPKGWIQFQTSGDELFRAVDINSTGFSTTYTISKIIIADDVPALEVSSLVALNHAQNLLAFRVLSQQEVQVYGRTAYELDYVYVESNPDLTHSEMPKIVRGTDYIFVSNGEAVIVSYQVDEKNYDVDLSRFLLFLRSIKF